MDGDIKTTFIPKKASPIAPATGTAPVRQKATSFLNIIATLVFVVALLSSGGVYLYKLYLNRSIATMQETIDRAEKAFEPSLILELVRLDTRLKVSTQLLAKHTAFSPLFRFLEQSTLPEVSFTSFQFQYDEGVPRVQMKGLATRYTPIAQQSNVLGESNLIVDHIFSNFALTDSGRVSFDLNYALNPDLLLFTSRLSANQQSSQ